MQVTHLKRWTFVSLLRADILDRAIPWTRLILRAGHFPADLNLDRKSRLSAVAAWALLAFLAPGYWFPWAWFGALGSLLALGGLNANLYRFFAQKGGLGFAVGAVGLHALYLLYSSLTFVLIAVPAWLAQRG